MKTIRKWWGNWKLKQAFKVIESHGLSVVKLVKHSNGDVYFAATDGSLRKIGK